MTRIQTTTKSFSQWNPPGTLHRSDYFLKNFLGVVMEPVSSISLYIQSRIPKFLHCLLHTLSEGCKMKFQGKPNFDKADWNNVENAWDELWSSAFTLICDLADDVLIIHSTR